MPKCIICNKTIPNEKVLGYHMAKRHPNGILEEEKVSQAPEPIQFHLKEDVWVGINSKAYSGKEFVFDNPDLAAEFKRIVTESYGGGVFL